MTLWIASTAMLSTIHSLNLQNHGTISIDSTFSIFHLVTCQRIHATSSALSWRRYSTLCRTERKEGRVGERERERETNGKCFCTVTFFTGPLWKDETSWPAQASIHGCPYFSAPTPITCFEDAIETSQLALVCVCICVHVCLYVCAPYGIKSSFVRRSNGYMLYWIFGLSELF